LSEFSRLSRSSLRLLVASEKIEQVFQWNLETMPLGAAAKPGCLYCAHLARKCEKTFPPSHWFCVISKKFQGLFIHTPSI